MLTTAFFLLSETEVSESSTSYYCLPHAVFVFWFNACFCMLKKVLVEKIAETSLKKIEKMLKLWHAKMQPWERVVARENEHSLLTS